MLTAIRNRRSIRKYKDAPVPKELLKAVLQAGIEAPSAKNRQPWRFVVTTGAAKEEALAVMEKGLLRERESARIPGSEWFLPDAFNTLRIMREAPVVIYIIDIEGKSMFETLDISDHLTELCNIQSIGACIENMSLAAEAVGLGSLWINNTYFAYDELLCWLKTGGSLVAALAVGYPNEAPPARLRKSPEELIIWREE